jgi:hypothetical protein
MRLSEHSQPAPGRPLAKRPAFWLALVAVLLLVGVAIAGGVAIGSMTDASTSDAASDSAAPTSPATEAPASATAEPRAAGVAIPADCAGIYTRDWAPDLAPRVLNPAWTADPGSDFKGYGSSDVGLVTVLEATTKLECNWVPESGAGHVFLITGVAQLTPEQQAGTLEYLDGTDLECFDELEGVRCLVERSEGGENWGESHFIREGVWIATRWGGSGPDGYTHDIVAAIFG